MPNTKATGVAYADPQFDSVTVTGTSTLAAVTATTVTASGAVTSTATNGAAVANGTAGLYFLTSAITANSTTTTAPTGSLGMTSHATGLGKLFYSDGTKCQYAAVS